MKWANHKLVTTVVVFAGTGNFYMQHIVFLAVYCQIDWKVNHQKKAKLIGNGAQSIAKIHIGQCLI